MVNEHWWTLMQIEIKSFLGVGPRGIRFDLDRPVIVLYGPSGSGKSTIVSAIEWALFGRIGTASSYSVTGVGDNALTYRSVIHTGSSDAQVTLRFHMLDRTLVWTRSRNSGTPRPDSDDVTCLVDGIKTEADAESVFGLTNVMYSRGIAPPQTTLRNLVHSELKDRNEALDHLFGLETLNRVSVGFSQGRGDIAKVLKELGERFERLSDRLRDPIRSRFDKRTEARQAAITAGTLRDDLNYETALSSVRQISASLSGGAAETDRPSLDELQENIAKLQIKADNTWTNAGPQEKLKRLTRLRQTVPDTRTNWQNAVNAVRTTSQKLGELVKETGDLEAATLNASKSVKVLEVAESILADADKKAAVLDRAKTWLADHHHDSDLACPVCQRGIGTGDLASAIETSLQMLTGSDGAIRQAKEKVTEARSGMELAENTVARLAAVTTEVKRLGAAVLKSRKAVLSYVVEFADEWSVVHQLGERESTIHKLLQSARELSSESSSDDDELDRLLRDLISEVEKALEETTEELRGAADQVEKTRIHIISTQRLLEFLVADQSLSLMKEMLLDQRLEAASASITAAKRIEAVVRKLAEAAGNLSEIEAREITTSISKPLNKWFGWISGHDLLKGAMVTAGKGSKGGIVRNTYQIRATDVSRLNPVPAGYNLSGGYEMVLAVSALCAIREQMALSHSLGLFVLDEPTESMDPELEEAMSRTLGLHAPGHPTIITTNRPDFASGIQTNAGLARAKVLNLRQWTVIDGTVIE